MYPNEPEPGAKVIPNRPGLLWVLGFAGIIAALTQTLVLPLLPIFPATFEVTVTSASWIATSTMLVGAVSAPLLGWLGDRFGLREVILIALFVLAVGSIISALSQSLAPMIVGRVLQGFAVGIIGISIALLRRLWRDDSLPFAVGVISGTIGIGTSLGVPLSGLIVAMGSWQTVFWIIGGCSILAACLVWLHIPSLPALNSAPFDLLGVVGLTSAATLGLILIGNIPQWGVISAASLTCAVGVVTIGWVWIRSQLRSAAPFVDIRLITRPQIAVSHIVALLLGFSFFLSFTGTIAVSQMPRSDLAGLGGTVLLTGMVQTPASLIAILAPLLAGLVAMKLGIKNALLIGIGSATLAFGFRCLDLTDPVPIAASAMLVSGGISFAFAILPVALMNATPLDQIGSSNGVNMLGRQLGASSASVIGGVILADTLSRSAIDPHLAFYWLFGLGAVSASLAFILVVFTRSFEGQSPSPAESKS